MVLIDIQVWEMLLPVSCMKLSMSLAATVATEEAAPMTRCRATIQTSMNGASLPLAHTQVIRILFQVYNSGL